MCERDIGPAGGDLNWRFSSGCPLLPPPRVDSEGNPLAEVRVVGAVDLGQDLLIFRGGWPMEAV